jgi:drug/metabolite transporter (DMT)-like permease
MGWGLAGVGTRAVFAEGVSTFTVVVLRTTIATAIVVGFVVASRRSIDKKAWWEGALIGVPRIGLAPIFFIGSLNYISAGFEAIVITLIPVATALMARFTLDEALRRNHVIGLTLGVAGSVVLILSGESGIADGTGNAALGGLLAMGGVFFGALSIILSRKYAPQHDTATLAAPMFTSGLGVALGAGLLVRDVDVPAVTPEAWWLIVALALGSTLLPFLTTLWASRHASATQVALTAYLAPVIGVIGGWLLLDEVISPSIVIGGVLTLAGVYLVSRTQQATPIVTVPARR